MTNDHRLLLAITNLSLDMAEQIADHAGVSTTIVNQLRAVLGDLTMNEQSDGVPNEFQDDIPTVETEVETMAQTASSWKKEWAEGSTIATSERMTRNIRGPKVQP